VRGTRLQFKGESATHLSYSMSVLSLAVASLLCSTAVEDQWSRMIIIMMIVMMMRDWVVMRDSVMMIVIMVVVQLSRFALLKKTFLRH